MSDIRSACDRRQLLVGSAAIAALPPIAAAAPPSGAPAGPDANALAGRAASAHDVRVSFPLQPYSDYLRYLLFRQIGDFPDLKAAVPIATPPLDHPIYLPDAVAARTLGSYADLYRMAKDEDARERLKQMLSASEPQFPAFLAFWRARIEPVERHRNVLWARQNRDEKPFVRLQEIERVPAKFSEVIVATEALNPSAASNPNGRVPVIFAGTHGIVDDFAWVVGHEGTHMLIGAKGANWQARPKAAEVLRLVSAKGGGFYDVEEALCLVMQVKLSAALNPKGGAKSVAKDLKPSITRSIVERMEANWSGYLHGSQDAVDYMLDQALAVMQAGEFPPAGRTTGAS